MLSANPIGIAPIGWRPVPQDVDSFLAELAGLRYDGIQYFSSLPGGAGTRELLSRHGLSLAEVYAPLPCTPDGPTATAVNIARRGLRTLVDAGGSILVAALDGTPDRDSHAGRSDMKGAPALTEPGWRALGDAIERLAEEAAREGVGFAFHPHAGTYVETPAEVEKFMAVTDPGVGLCVDTGHDLVGGGDPGKTIRWAGSRVAHVHLKDVDPVVLDGMRHFGGMSQAIERRVFTTLGSGILDLPGVLTALSDTGYRGWLMVEQDTTWEPPPEAAAVSRRTLADALRHPG